MKEVVKRTNYWSRSANRFILVNLFMYHAWQDNAHHDKRRTSTLNSCRTDLGDMPHKAIIQKKTINKPTSRAL